MINNRSYFRLFSAEIFKMKRNAGVFIMLFAPLLFTILFFTYFALKNEMYAAFGINIWLNYLSFYFTCYSLFYPIMVAIFCYSYTNIEYENNCFKQLFTLPVSRNEFYFTKVAVIFSVVILSVLVAYVSFILSGNILDTLFPDMGFQDFDMRGVIDVLFIRTGIILLSISMVQFSLSLLYPNFLFSLSFALFFTVLSMLLSKFEYIPYMFIHRSLKLAVGQENEIIVDKIISVSMIYAVVFMIVGLIIFKKITKYYAGRN